MSTRQLLVRQTADGVHIDGIVNIDDDLKALVGTAQVKEAAAVDATSAADKLDQLVVDAVRGGTHVLGGYVKFAHPIVIKGAKLSEPAQQSAILTTSSQYLVIDQTSKSAADESSFTMAPQMQEPCVTVDDGGFTNLLNAVASKDKDAIEKAAACDFVEQLINSAEAAKVDGKQLGFTMPVKVAFKDDDTRDFFLNLFKTKKQAADTKIQKTASALIAAGVVKSSLRDKLTSVLDKMAKKA